MSVQVAIFPSSSTLATVWLTDVFLDVFKGRISSIV